MSGNVATEVRIDLNLLDDRYIEQIDAEWSDQPVAYPTLYRLEVDGTAWLTDRYWMLPESVCMHHDFPVEPLPRAANVAKAAGWVEQILNADVAGPVQRRFAPPFAGYLTRVGISAVNIGEPSGMHALADADGNRIGGLMPLREVSQYDVALPIPCSPEVVALFERITAANILRPWQAWHLAAHLNGTTS